MKKEDFYNTKIDLGEDEDLRRENSIKVQEKLFELGSKWGGSTEQTTPNHLHKRFLFIDKNGLIRYTSYEGNEAEGYFDKHENRQVDLENIIPGSVSRMPQIEITPEISALLNTLDNLI